MYNTVQNCIRNVSMMTNESGILQNYGLSIKFVCWAVAETYTLGAN